MSHGASVRRVVARNTLWNYGGFVVNLTTNLLMFPFVVRHLGDAASGVWLLFSAVTGYMGLLELGIVPSLTQMIAASLARGEREHVSRAASSSQAVLAFIAALAVVVLWPSAPALVRLLSIPDTLREEAQLAFLITIVGFALRMPLATFQSILLGFQRQDRCNQLWIAVGLAKFAGAGAILGAGHGLAALVAWEMVVHLLAGVLQVTWVFAEMPDLRLSWRLVNRDDISRLLTFGSTILIVSLSSLIIEQTDRFVVAAFLPIADVTYYAAAWKIYMLAFVLTTIVVQAVSPVAAELHGRGDESGLRSLFLRTTKFSLIVAWPLVMSLAFAGGFLLRVWMGKSFVSTLPVVQALLVGFIVTAHNHAGYSALIGMRRVGPTVWRYFVPQAALNLVLSVLLAPRFGLLGVALGTTLPAIALEGIYLKVLLGELRVSWWEFVTSAVVPLASAAVIAFAPVAILYMTVDSQSPLLPVAAMLCSLLYLGLVVRRLDVEEREDLLAYLPRALRERVRSVVRTSRITARMGEGV